MRISYRLIIGSVLLQLLFAGNGMAQQQDLNIRYTILGTTYGEKENKIKIKVPPYLSRQEVSRQIRLAIAWPGDPLPEVLTKVYVFRDDAVLGNTSRLGGIYSPVEGFIWHLRGWAADTTIVTYELTSRDRQVYNTLLDSMFAKQNFKLESKTLSATAKRDIAWQFDLSTTQVDSIFYLVKWWRELNGAEGP